MVQSCRCCKCSTIVMSPRLPQLVCTILSLVHNSTVTWTIINHTLHCFYVFFCGVWQDLFCVVQCWRTVLSARRPFPHRNWQPRRGRASSKVSKSTNRPTPSWNAEMSACFFSLQQMCWWLAAGLCVNCFLLAPCRPSRLGAWWSLQLLHCLQGSLHCHPQEASL